MRSLALAGMLAVAALVSGGCAVTRQQQLERSAEALAGKLTAERDRVLAVYVMKDDERVPRLEHLSGLRYTLSAANVALAAVPRVVPEGDRDLAYDVIEEVHGVIGWNIPLGPKDPKRALPALFAGNELNVAGLRAGGAGGAGAGAGGSAGSAVRPRGMVQ
jgi:hypothetical protein